MVEEIVEPGERSTRGHAGVVAARGGAPPGRDPCHVGAVAGGRLRVGEVFNEDVCGLRDAAGGRVGERDEVAQIHQHLRVLHRLVRVVDIRVVQPVDPGIQDRDADPFPRDPRGLYLVRPDGRHAFVQWVCHGVIMKSPVECDRPDAGDGRERIDRGRRGNSRHHREMLELEHAGPRGKHRPGYGIARSKSGVVGDDDFEGRGQNRAQERQAQRGVEQAG